MIAHKRRKSILMAMWNRDLIGFQLGYTSYVLKTFRTFGLLNKMLPIGLCWRLSKSSWAQTIMLDAVVRFIPSFAWTALSGFQSTGIPFFAQVAFSGFRLAGCTFFLFVPNFCPNLFLFFFFGSPGCPFLPGLFCSFCPERQFMRSIFWLHLS